jgi:AraC-like DNA-binding protein
MTTNQNLMIIKIESQAAIIGTEFDNIPVERAENRVPHESPPGKLAAEVIERIGNSVDFMHSHLSEPLQVSTLASVANISASHFFAMFKRLMGCAPIEFFISLRMRRACDLLDETALSVKEVAATLGYDDQFYFSRVFKSATQMPPTHYRVLDDAARSTIKARLAPVYNRVPGNEVKSLGLTISGHEFSTSQTMTND